MARAWFIAVAAALLAGAAARVAGPPAPIRYATGRQIARLANPQITESSGLAASTRTDGVFWTHNDSGDSPRLFAFNGKGEDLGTFAIRGAAAVDWEDMASFALGGRHYLLIADVGDNAARRVSCTLYFVLEPPLAAKPDRPPRPAALPLAARVDFTYADGPHNCESVGVDVPRGEVLLVSKAGGECKAYTLPLPRRDWVRGAVARAVGTLRIPTTTAMDVSPDGLRAVVLTYGDAHEYARDANEDWQAAFARAPRTIKMPRRAQGESICFGRDGRTLYLTSEKQPCPLLEVAPADANAAGK